MSKIIIIIVKIFVATFNSLCLEILNLIIMYNSQKI